MKTTAILSALAAGLCFSISSFAQAPASAPGQVWVNTDTKVYHCAADKRYGKTQHGEYMPEAAAKAQGFRASHGKACS
ncbi:hypothetical protein BTI_3870 [Burkholderia thailandensis MSMB121]|uniref:hypothetical protein n=1 Tax=Burkholderia humptydooensis TaxID=430531 RepID=UPI0003280E46|nr:hypothetical protein [Burkholderia humptydooensis]AGK51216.1 hypothetical protein BTI_3870 [Burkholderia thailandensis MSMB121]ATF32524.1 hypothetical protein CO709_03320 [Burkholderia thailandensis]KST70619.1 hypothetical protein WS76_18370 [Burkholderia humptydooensis]